MVKDGETYHKVKKAEHVFLRVHRSYAINAQHIESIGITNIRVSGRDVPIQKSYRSALLETIESFK